MGWLAALGQDLVAMLMGLAGTTARCSALLCPQPLSRGGLFCHRTPSRALLSSSHCCVGSRVLLIPRDSDWGQKSLDNVGSKHSCPFPNLPFFSTPPPQPCFEASSAELCCLRRSAEKSADILGWGCGKGGGRGRLRDSDNRHGFPNNILSRLVRVRLQSWLLHIMM